MKRQVLDIHKRYVIDLNLGRLVLLDYNPFTTCIYVRCLCIIFVRNGTTGYLWSRSMAAFGKKHINVFTLTCYWLLGDGLFWSVCNHRHY